jgi:phage gpG-like protein
MAMRMEWHGDLVQAMANRAVRAGLMECALAVQKNIQRQLKQKMTPRDSATQSTPGNPPGLLTGALVRSIQVDKSKIDNALPAVRIGTSLEYAAVHEFGKPIRAKNVRNLTVPLNDTARSLRRRFKSLRQIPGLKLWPGGKVLGRFIGPRSKKRWEGLFLLVPMIKMPMRPFMRPGFEAAKHEFQKIWRAVFWRLAGTVR